MKVLKALKQRYSNIILIQFKYSSFAIQDISHTIKPPNS